MLVVQAILFVWVASRSGPIVPGQPPDRFAQTVARDIASELERQPGIDLAQYVRDEYGRSAYQLFVVLADGRAISNGLEPVPGTLVEQAKVWLSDLERAGGATGREGRQDRGDSDAFGPFGRPRAGEREASGFRSPRPVPIFVAGQPRGVVVVPPRPPFGFLLRRYAPTLALVAVGALVAGALVAAVAIFGPARRRLRSVEDAARRLGAGDLTARAPDHGGDEVAAVAGAFNAMASDLAVRAAALAASDRARRQLLADVSHELTTPVTAMRGYLETLAMPEIRIDEATRARYLGIIGDEMRRLEQIIGDLLDLARLEGGGGGFLVERVAVDRLFARVKARHEPACRDANVAITVSIGPGAEAVAGDANRLEQALQNLAANAIRYAPPNSVVELGARAVEHGVSMTVTDAGPGIAPEHLAHVFERFYKAEPSRTSAGQGPAGGSGLGLSIVKAIVERHGATISVTSHPGRTVFSFVLPRSVPASSEASG
jgi:signal transduction histidine kinase